MKFKNDKVKKYLYLYFFYSVSVGCQNNTLEEKNDTIQDAKTFRNGVVKESEGKIIPKSLILNDIKGNKIKLESLQDNSKKLFFRFTDINCNPCIESELALIKHYNSMLGQNNVILLTSFDNPRGLSVMLSKLNLTNKVVSINKDSLLLPIEKLAIPYYFVLDEKDSKVISMLIPEKTDFKLTKDYFERIKNILEKPTNDE